MSPAFFRVIVHDLARVPSLTGTCAGFDQGAWRVDALCDHILEFLPEFSLNHSERKQLNSDTAVQMLRRAARAVYSTDDFGRRGEFGELLLHAILREVFGTIPAISKIYFKDSANDTVKGFDAVHVVADSEERLELWLGEVKFYTDLRQAIRDAVRELHAHSSAPYLRGEFVAIRNKLDSSWPFVEKLKQLLHEKTSLDDVFAVTCVPVLLTYDGVATTTHNHHSPEYELAVSAEFEEAYRSFVGSKPPEALTIRLILLPLATKQTLVERLHTRLRAWQAI